MIKIGLGGSPVSGRRHKINGWPSRRLPEQNSDIKLLGQRRDVAANVVILVINPDRGRLEGLEGKTQRSPFLILAHIPPIFPRFVMQQVQTNRQFVIDQNVIVVE